MNKTSRYYSLVVNIPTEYKDKFDIDVDVYTFSKLKSHLDYTFIALILHDLDLNEAGVLKTEHLHVIIQLNKNISFLKFLDLISDILDFPKECISIENINNFNKCVRYLIHKDSPDKFQYFEGKVLTTDVARFDNIITCADFDYLDYSTLLNICKSCTTVVDVMSVIGLQNYKKYRQCIIDIMYSLNN